MNKVFVYNAKGCVYGNFWGGGRGFYSARSFRGYVNKEHLICDLNLAFNDESIDGGMGYENLISALMEIETIETIFLEDKPYSNHTVELITLGKKLDKRIKNTMIEFMSNY